ncbi:MAG: YkgJ family cysteine cluster protein [Bacteroidota bacterium]
MLITEYLFTSEREGKLKKQDIIHDIQAEMVEYFKNVRERSRKEATKTLMKKVDKTLDKYITKSNLHQCISCKKGCSACCSTRVTITEDEGLLIKDYIEKHNIEYDLVKIDRLRNLDSDGWNSIPVEERKCAFLDNNGACKIYPVRPTTCRKLMVTSDSQQCRHKLNTFNIDRVLDYKSEILVSAIWQVSKTGNLPDIMYPLLNK